jgi:hypothetical protein
MSKHWYCKIEGKEEGPFSALELKSLVSEGRLKPEDPIRRDDHKQWTSARHVKGLFSESAGSQSVPPPLPKIPQGEENGDSLPSGTEEAVLPVIQVDTPPPFSIPSETAGKSLYSHRRRQQKKMQFLALGLLGGVFVLGIVMFLVFTGVLGPNHPPPVKSDKTGVENNAGPPEADAAAEEVGKK